MIKKISRKNIDTLKYDACILSSKQYKIYAFSWYLDIVSTNWDVLVYNDYQAVMPIPWKQKIGIRYITQPFFCQQLGVFSLNTISDELLQLFWCEIPFFWWKRGYHFNSENTFFQKFKNVETRDNYILKLNTSFEELLNNCSKNRKRDYQKALDNQLKFVENLCPKIFLSFIQMTEKPFDFHGLQFPILEQLATQKQVFLSGVQQNNQLIAVLLGLKNTNRITYLFPLHHPKAKKLGVATFLILELIRKYQNSKKVLDFEGSMVKGVANFYKSFNSENETYTILN